MDADDLGVALISGMAVLIGLSLLAQPRTDGPGATPTMRIGFTVSATLLTIESLALTGFVLFIAALGCTESENGGAWCDHKDSALPFAVLIALCAAQAAIVVWGTAQSRRTGWYRGIVIAAVTANALAILTAVVFLAVYTTGPIDTTP